MQSPIGTKQNFDINLEISRLAKYLKGNSEE